MLKKYDQTCEHCGWLAEVRCEPGVNPPCPQCGSPTVRIYLGGYDIVSDEFPGGKTFENLGDQPVTVYSKSELKREMEMRGLVNVVKHVPVPGSDKSPVTQRFV